ncbi:MAG: HNH endonuclease [Bradymonadales bacterium]|nr:MAG: HNH endonuclease [Bradymonadales bacterium]
MESDAQLYQRVLVLNRCFLPIHITTVKRAVNLLFLEAAAGVDPNYEVFDWVKLQESPPKDQKDEFHWVKTVRGELAIPRVIVLKEFDKLPQKNIRFSRSHIFIRDQFTCQYCQSEFPRTKLNLDHVVPRSRGGRTTWENVVTSCVSCNRVKANRTPQEARMPLRKPPKRPAGSLGLLNLRRVHKAWSPFLVFDV